MPDWADEIRARLASLRLRPEREVEIVEELAQHLDDTYRSSLAAGHNETSASVAAWRELERPEVLGRELAACERARPTELPPPGASAGGWALAVWQDVRHAARTLRRQPVFTATVLLALALSIGPITAIVSYGNWLFWRPLPGVTDHDRLGLVWFGYWDSRSVGPAFVSYFNRALLKSMMKTAVGFVGVQESSASLVVGDELPRSVGLAHVTADFFDVLGVRTAAGRVLREEEDRPPLGAPVAVISEKLATATFGSPAAALGKRLALNRKPFNVIGVADAGFLGIETTSAVDVWVTGATSPYLWGHPDPSPDARGGGRFYQFVVRLAPGADFRQLEAELGTLAPWLAETHPEENRKFRQVRARVFPKLGLPALMRAPALTVVSGLGAVGGLLLLLGCANVANLLIARAIGREPEFAIRKALGASHIRLMQAELALALALALGGAALGLGVAVALKQLIQQSLLPGTRGVTLPIDQRVLIVTIGVALLTGTLAGLVPAWIVARKLGTAIGQSGPGSTATHAPRLRSGLASLQLALSLALVVGALLLIQSLHNLRSIDLGFDPSNVTTVQVDLEEHGYTRERATLYHNELMNALTTLGIETATIAQRAPFDSGSIVRVLPPGASANQTIAVNSNGVAHNYFETLRSAIVRGRPFTAEEAFAVVPAQAMPVIINETLARQLFGMSDPVGRAIRLPRTASNPARDLPVVGVARDAYWRNMTGEPEPFLYQPLGRYDFGSTRATVIVRSTQPTAAVTAAVRALAARIDRGVPLSDSHPLSAGIDRAIQPWRLTASMLSWLSALAFVLAAAGLHGLVSQTTIERTREFGIRLAVGAGRADIARLVARYVLTIASIGTLAGLLLAGFGARLLKRMLFGVTALDLAAYAAALASMILVVVVASVWPAVRAIRVQPVDVLRAE